MPCVQEIGQREALEDLRARLGDCWHAISSEHPDQRRMRVGFLSTLPFAEVEQVVEFPAALQSIQQGDEQGSDEHAMGRGALRVRLEHDGQPVDLVTCHLKSKLLSFRSDAGYDELPAAQRGSASPLRRRRAVPPRRQGRHHPLHEGYSAARSPR